MPTFPVSSAGGGVACSLEGSSLFLFPLEMLSFFQTINQIVDGISSISRDVTSNLQQHPADVQGAEITIPNQLNLLVSNVVRTALSGVTGQDETLGTRNQTIDDVVNHIPIVGHANAYLQHAAGNEEGRARALAAANRSVVVGGAGAFGMVIGGPSTAAVAGAVAGIAADFVTSISQQDRDHPDGVLNLFNDHSPDAVVATLRGVVSDGLVGYATGTTVDRMWRSHDIKAIEYIETRRQEVGTAGKITNHTVQAVVIDKKTGKKYYGTNQNKRRQSKLNPKIIGPNIFVEKFKADPLPPRSKAIGRHASTCAEAEAYHFMLIDNPNADLSQTLVRTYLRKDGGWKNMERCDNCKARDHAMGKVPTDPLDHGFEEFMFEQPYYSLVRNMDLDVHYAHEHFYTGEHSVPSRSEYDRRIYRSFATAATYRQSHQ